MSKKDNSKYDRESRLKNKSDPVYRLLRKKRKEQKGVQVKPKRQEKKIKKETRENMHKQKSNGTPLLGGKAKPQIKYQPPFGQPKPQVKYQPPFGQQARYQPQSERVFNSRPPRPASTFKEESHKRPSSRDELSQNRPPKKMRSNEGFDRNNNSHPQSSYKEPKPTKITNQFPEYRAAGVILYSILPGRAGVRFLLGEEDRSEKMGYKGSAKNVWLNFGGKIEDGERDPSQTALREFIEETGGLFTESEIEIIRGKMNRQDCPKFYVLSGKYMLYFVEYPHDETIPQRFKDLSSKNSKSKQTEIMWCDAQSIVASVTQRLGYFISRNIHGQERQHPFYAYFFNILSTTSVLNFMKRLLRKSSQPNTTTRNSLKGH